ncbi:PREDICTED: oligoribonuclease, mitochondrial [Nicrophorus vespilloides]|uniref:Oligoribonuclease, mitochondrial n=1 Tax=Nicrophorus vespilloides TaxID=110193 RepID=A0ABM1NGY6_NICVS|nr:PREDICTED: oligoribonuclease, mitochondrial [Nicrophorus vespilloides]
MLCSMLRSVRHSLLGNTRQFSKMVLDVEMNRIVWVDLEMTGLDIENDTIMEIACIVTDSDLNIIAEGPNLIIQTPEEKLKEMNEWCVKQHSKTGLTEAAKNSQITLQQAEDTVMDFITKHVTKSASPLAGNSVYMDRLFLKKYMPKLDEYLHYRIIDTSTIKELCRRWNNDLFKNVPKKEYNHRALTDIRDSIKELQFYKGNFFKINESSNVI